MTHTSAEAISYLKTSAEEVRVKKNESKVLRTNKCELCALFKTYCVVSQNSAKSDKSIKSFEHITFNLMKFQPAYNRYKQVSHIICNFSDFNMI